jgi:hypothetical protein
MCRHADEALNGTLRLRADGMMRGMMTNRVRKHVTRVCRISHPYGHASMLAQGGMEGGFKAAPDDAAPCFAELTDTAAAPFFAQDTDSTSTS